MAIYEDQVSKRLESFLNNHLEFEDIGDPENGPMIDSRYVGPVWAMDLFDCATDWTEYQFMVALSNFMEE